MRFKQVIRITLIVQGVLLGLLALAGLIVALTSGGPANVLGFRLNVPHSSLLLAVAVAGLLTAKILRWAKVFLPLQMGGFALLFVIGSAVSAGPGGETFLALNAPDLFLHLGLALIALTLGMLLASPWAAGDRELGQER